MLLRVVHELHKKIGHTDRDARYPQITQLSFPAQGGDRGWARLMGYPHLPRGAAIEKKLSLSKVTP